MSTSERTSLPGTDRTLRTQSDLERIDFRKLDGLVPLVAQDVADRALLMVGFADRQALEVTLETGELHFHSRSRGALWRKGETSGNVLSLVSLHADCDADTVLAVVRPAGPTCHTGERTCFGALPATGAPRVEAAASSGALARLDATLADRAHDRPEGSYTVRLLDDRNLRLKKLGEETAELVAALATSDTGRATEEAADLVYHLLVALRAEGIGLAGLLEALEARAG